MQQTAGPQSANGVLAPRLDAVEVIGPHRIADPYRWLEDAADPRTRTWLAHQQAGFRRAREQWPLVDGFRRRLAELAAFEACSAPLWRGLQAFYTYRGPADEHASLRTRRYSRGGGPAGPERVLLDPMRLDPARCTTLDAWSPSPDGRLVACQISAGGTERPLLRILDRRSGEFRGPPISGCRFSPMAWLPDGSGFYYVREVRSGAGQRVWRHRIGTAADIDQEIFGHDLEPGVDLDLAADPAVRRLLVTVDDGSGTAIWLLPDPQATPAAPGFQIAACRDGWSAVWPGADGRLYLLTDDDAPHGRIVVAGAAAAGTDRGRTLVPENPAATLESFAILDGRTLARPLIMVVRNQDGHSRLSCHDLRTGDHLKDVRLPGAGIVTELSCRPDGTEAWFGYTDVFTPPTVYRFEATTGAVRAWRRRSATARPRGVRASELRYPSADGTQVRMLLTRPAGRAGPLPAILHAYGAFGEPQLADYYELGLAWAEAGGLLAIPCVRGGGEEGESWHEAGMLAHKQRGIDDLLAAAEYLISAGLAAPGRVGVKGFSAGGLLAAAAFVQRPDLFAAAECTSPLLDMARYELSGMGPHWTGEFGSRADPEELGWMLAYSPYHNVTVDTRYPAVLLATFDGDTRVDPMHARKMCAALQHATSRDRPVLLRTEPGVGHGQRSRSALVSYFADVLGFFSRHLAGSPASFPVQDQAMKGGVPHDQEVEEALQRRGRRRGQALESPAS